ncbi:hypothetical protein [Listeria fleischmannii]|uniref:Bacteriophage protein n=1 Tax=Listeria fleischmannii FSL S10-1203 TaxID=1265822 RepID=W7DX69_9LIST|nr:hypothetical protein [Listeria fleischmannii]EUJ64846.1 bacteriophage protein [Listeria fleischmannii FSL S10-1203]
MKTIFCQPASTKFKWQLQVALHNLKKHGIKSKDIVLLFLQENSEVVRYFEQLGYEVHAYSGANISYLPAIKPFLWSEYLKEDPTRENETYFYLDSDVILREKINFRTARAKEDMWICSDCNGYLNLDYIRQCKNGEQILNDMAQIVGVTVESLETINKNSGGAQWLIKNPKADYWEKVYADSIKLYNYLSKAQSNIQAWTAEMWAQLWNMMFFNIGPKVHKELDFCWATDDIKKWDQVKIYHDAGVTKESKDLFFKGKYNQRSPFGEDLSFVNPKKCSYRYVQEIQETAGEL